MILVKVAADREIIKIKRLDGTQLDNEILVILENKRLHEYKIPNLLNYFYKTVRFYVYLVI